MACNDLRILLNGKEDCFSPASSAKENGKRFSFKNHADRKICRIRVDECLISGEQTKKCDYFFGIHSEERYFLVELKGQAIDTAIQQIERTFEIVNQRIKAHPTKYTGIIVSSSVPKAANQKFKNLQEKLYRDKQLMVKRKQFQYEEVL